MGKASARELIIKARAGLILDQPFFGALALRLIPEENQGIPTAATDGRRLLYNPNFIEAHTLEEVKGILAHEVMHCSSQHHTRRGERNPQRWNVAGDHVINHVLKGAGFRLPDGHLDDPQFHDMSTDAVYSALPEDQGGGSGGGGQGGPGDDPGGCGGVMDATDEDGNKAQGAAQTEVEQEWQVATIQAAQAARMQGKLPAGVERMLDDILNPKVDWREVLRSFIERAARNDYSWTLPNSRYVQQGLYMPRLHSLELGEIVVAVDTSGSIGQAELSQFAGELSGMLEAYPMTAHVIYIDTEVAGSETFTSEDLPIELHPAGGGGTAFSPAFLWVEAQEIEPAAMIYLTDMYGSFPDTPPDYPVIWCVIGGWNGEAPFGEIANINE